MLRAILSLKAGPFGSRIVSGNGIELVPLTRDCRDDRQHVERLLRWRRGGDIGFARQVVVDEASTGRWLARLIEHQPDRILFYIRPLGGPIFGHIGLCGFDPVTSSMLIEEVVRGEPCPDGSMAAAVEALGGWARDLGLLELGLDVFADNVPALRLFTRVGLVPYATVPLRGTEVAGGVEWATCVAGERPDRFFLKMRKRLDAER